MKATLTLNTAANHYSFAFDVRKAVSLLVLSSLFFIVSSRSTHRIEEQMMRIDGARVALQQHSSDIEHLHASTTARLTQVYQQVAELRAHLHAVNARAELLADELGVERPDLAVFTPSTLSLVEQDPLLQALSEAKLLTQAKQAQLQVLEQLFIGQRVATETDIVGRPVTTGWLSSYFGERTDPFTGEPAFHKGLDFAGEMGGAVIATAAGIVSWAGERWGYGLMVEIEHGDGWVTRYAHNGDIQVSMGEVVTKGQRIASIGSSGRSTGAHVHYEVLKHGQPINPLPFVYKKSTG